MRKIISLLLIVATLFMAVACAETDEQARYESAMEYMENGDFSSAKELFYLLGGTHGDSMALYFYCAAREFEQNGDLDSAKIIYGLLPGFMDCDERGKGESFSIGMPIEKTEIGSASDESIVLPDVELMAYHDFADVMPVEFDDFSKSEGYYTLYYTYDEGSPLEEYCALFETAGWPFYTQESSGWLYYYYTSPDHEIYFYIAVNAEEELMAFMFNSDSDYGFDPANGLH